MIIKCFKAIQQKQLLDLGGVAGGCSDCVIRWLSVAAAGLDWEDSLPEKCYEISSADVAG